MPLLGRPSATAANLYALTLDGAALLWPAAFGLNLCKDLADGVDD